MSATDRNLQLHAKLDELEALEEDLCLLVGQVIDASRRPDWTLTAKILRQMRGRHEKADALTQTLLILLSQVEEDAPP